MLNIPGPLVAKEPTTKQFLICPNGRIATRIIKHGATGEDINELDDCGNVTSSSSDQFPDMEAAGIDSQHIHDGDGGDFLWRHCRLVSGPADYDHYADDNPPVIEPWPEEIVHTCGQAEHVAWCLWRLEQFQEALPPRYDDDVAFTAALNRIVKGRLEAELKELEDRIAAFRKDRVEATTFDHDGWAGNPCKTCAEAIETRLLPCDECGALDGEVEDA